MIFMNGNNISLELRPGYEYWRLQMYAETRQFSQSQFDELMNDDNLYQLKSGNSQGSDDMEYDTGDTASLVGLLIRGKRDEVIELVLSGSADINARDRDGGTVLHQAVVNNDESLVKMLLEYGALPDTKRKDGKTPLHFAAAYKFPNMINLLVKGGASLDIGDANGNTPLSDAVYWSHGDLRAAKSLVDAGADPDQQNKFGISPRGLASSVANYDMSGLFV